MFGGRDSVVKFWFIFLISQETVANFPTKFCLEDPSLQYKC